MCRLKHPFFNPNVVIRNNKRYILDPIRRKWIVLTPEEWVRQLFIHLLIEEYGYPMGTIANEVSLKIGKTSKRCDSLVYDKQLNPLMIIEYKAPEIKITQKVFDQITRYNIALKVPFLTITNGNELFCCKVNYELNNVKFLSYLPQYSELLLFT